MRTYLVRHATAVDRSPEIEDAARSLTPDGARDFAAVVEGLNALKIRFDRLLFSPWLRAVETAELLMPLLDGESEVTPLLADAPNADLLEQITGEHVALVGHRPWMGDLLAWLVTGGLPAGEPFEIKKGGVAVLDGDPRPGSMRLVALYPPRVLRALGQRSA